MFEDDFPFPKVGYVNSLEGNPFLGHIDQILRVFWFFRMERDEKGRPADPDDVKKASDQPVFHGGRWTQPIETQGNEAHILQRCEVVMKNKSIVYCIHLYGLFMQVLGIHV